MSQLLSDLIMLTAEGSTPSLRLFHDLRNLTRISHNMTSSPTFARTGAVTAGGAPVSAHNRFLADAVARIMLQLGCLIAQPGYVGSTVRNKIAETTSHSGWRCSVRG